LNGLWSDRLIEILTPNAPQLHFGEGLLHGDLKRLDYDLGDRYTLNPKIKENIKILKGLSVKLNSRKFY
jgi:hypothetical protein